MKLREHRTFRPDKWWGIAKYEPFKHVLYMLRVVEVSLGTRVEHSQLQTGREGDLETTSILYLI